LGSRSTIRSLPRRTCVHALKAPAALDACARVFASTDISCAPLQLCTRACLKLFPGLAFGTTHPTILYVHVYVYAYACACQECVHICDCYQTCTYGCMCTCGVHLCEVNMFFVRIDACVCMLPCV
jgi:hypothetical protein